MSTFCLAPYKLKDQGIYVPCGKCPNCWKRRISAWSYRLRKEMFVSSSTCWPTLTYNEDHVPRENGKMLLWKPDLQDFFKRLRKAQIEKHGCIVNKDGVSCSGIKYFAVGEYGGITCRPHYHVLLFNADVELVTKAWMMRKDTIGNVQFGQVTEASIGYTLKYMCKAPHKVDDDRPPQFCLMSKGLGASYLTEEMISWHKANLEDRMYCSDVDGKKVCMPRYYKKKVYSDSEREVVGMKMVINNRDKQYKEILEGFKEFGEGYYSHRTKCLTRAYNLIFEQSKKRKDL